MNSSCAILGGRPFFGRFRRLFSVDQFKDGGCLCNQGSVNRQRFYQLFSWVTQGPGFMRASWRRVRRRGIDRGPKRRNSESGTTGREKFRAHGVELVLRATRLSRARRNRETG